MQDPQGRRRPARRLCIACIEEDGRSKVAGTVKAESPRVRRRVLAGKGDPECHSGFKLAHTAPEAVSFPRVFAKTPRPASRDEVPLKIRIGPVLSGDLGKLMLAVAAFEVGNVAATLLILRASDLLAPDHGTKSATTIALALYTAYNVAATIASVPAGRLSDRLGARGPILVLAGGVAAFAAAYSLFTVDTTAIALPAVPFVLAGIGIGAVETAQHSAVAALAPNDLRGSAFGMLATVQSLGNLAASTVAGVLWSAGRRPRSPI